MSLGSYAGVELVDVRTFMDLRDGVRPVTKRGISLMVAPARVDRRLQLAQARIAERGLLPPHEG